MKLAIIYYGVYPHNRGIEQLAWAVKALGHEPQIVARSPSKPTHTNAYGIPLYQIPKKNKMPLRNIAMFHFPFNPFWRKLLIHLGRQNSWDGFIIRDTPLAWPALSAAKTLGVPAYLDMRENLAALYRMGHSDNPLKTLLRSPALVRTYEHITIPRFDHIFTVTHELQNWVLNTYPIARSQTSVLENTPSYDFLKNSVKARENAKKDPEVIRLVYAGYIRMIKGVGELLIAFGILAKKFPSITLRLIGSGESVEHAKDWVDKNGLSNRVEFFSMLSMEELTLRLAECDIGLETCPLNELTQQTLPGKLFEYMACGLATVSSNRAPVARVLRETGAGMVFKENNPETIAKTVSQLIENQAQMKKMGRMALKAIHDRYNYRITMHTLESVLGKYKHSALKGVIP